MGKVVKAGLGLVAAGVVIGAVAPVGVASTASLSLKSPKTVKVYQHFTLVASGVGTHKHNFVAIIFAATKCSSTYAAENKTAKQHNWFMFSYSVGKTFKVTRKNLYDSQPETVHICGYLLTSTTKSQEAKAFRKLVVTS